MDGWMEFLFLSFQFKFQTNFLYCMANSVQIPTHDFKGSQFLILPNADLDKHAGSNCTPKCVLL